MTQSASDSKKIVVGIGGTLRPRSSTELAVRRVLAHAEARGAETIMFTGPDLNFPMYGSGDVPETQRFVEALRKAHCIVIGSPGYHGGISGLVKNALDYVEEMSGDAQPYFDGRCVGCVSTGAGWQGANATLQALRGVVHALRGWPTPLGVALNSREPLFSEDGDPKFSEVDAQLRLLANQLISFSATSA